MNEIERYCILPSTSLQDAIRRMDELRNGIVLVTDKRRKLVGTITDGDVRRAILARVPLAKPISVLLQKKKGTRYDKPITARAGSDRESLRAILQKHHIAHVPLVDAAGRVVGLETLNDFVSDEALPLRAVIMAGGQGTRLYPLTKDTPKPLLPVGSEPLMETAIRRLSSAGIKKVSVTTHHLSHKIEGHFGDGQALGVDLKYVKEDKPLGTAGGLGLLEKSDETLLVMNGDIMTQVDFRSMLSFHKETRADLTVAVRQYDVRVPFGVLECDAERVRGITEKPEFNFFVSAGIYLLQPSARTYIKRNKRYNMTDLIEALIKDRRRVCSFPIREYWLDIGRPDDYEKANRDARGGQ